MPENFKCTDTGGFFDDDMGLCCLYDEDLIPRAPTSPPIPYFFNLSEASTCNVDVDMGRDFQQLNHRTYDNWDASHNDEDDYDHADLDDVDADLIEGDVEQGASGKALQDGNGQQVAATRLQHYCIQIKFLVTLFL